MQGHGGLFGESFGCMMTYGPRVSAADDGHHRKSAVEKWTSLVAGIPVVVYLPALLLVSHG